ncbi:MULTISPECIES: MaoC family dehydratase [Paracoccus]|uniref:MaoC family dehydratase n=1 Tax=Paracoccus TaxID=265 RepID=UPI00048E8A30|nr:MULTISPECIES: MaoC family dehydratase [Paracoccus]
MPGRYFDEFTPGEIIRHELRRTVCEADNIWFSLLTMNPQPLHVDAAYAAGTEWGQPLFNSMATLAILVGLSVQDTTLGTLVAQLGLTDVTFPKPVFHGDTLHAETEVLSLRESRSRPDAGIVEFRHRCLNQNHVVVAECRRVALMRRKAAA